jgi:RNA polymerase sigma-70 factor
VKRGTVFAALLERLDGSTARRLLDDPDSGAALRRALERATMGNPSLDVDLVRFARFLAPRIAGTADPAAALQALRIQDLHLAFGCLEQDPSALQWLVEVAFPAVELAVKPLEIPAEDIRQAMFIKVFLRGESTPPRIHDYGGRGALLKWLQVVAYRLGQNVLRGVGREALIDPAGVEVLQHLDGEDVELGLIRGLYGEELRSAFAEALTSLSSGQRRLLRRRLLDGEEVQAIAAREGVHRMTVTRWFNTIRRLLLQSTSRHLGDRLGMTSAETSSMVRALRRDLDVSVTSFLRGH